MMNFISHLSHGLSLTYWRTLLNALRNEFKVDLQVIMKFSFKSPTVVMPPMYQPKFRSLKIGKY